MENKHTPGPWMRSSFGFQVLGDKNRVSVCQLDGKQGQETQIANARLIAAAPEILEALGCLVSLKEWKDEYGKDEHYLIEQPLAWRRAEAAISKAIE